MAAVAIFPLVLATTKVFPLADGLGVSSGIVMIKLPSLISAFISFLLSRRLTPPGGHVG